jgi:hypothetical protein
MWLLGGPFNPKKNTTFTFHKKLKKLTTKNDFWELNGLSFKGIRSRKNGDQP